MGQKLSLLDHTSYQVVMLGLDNAGKSTTLYRLKTGEYVQPAPTIGFNCEKFKCTVYPPASLQEPSPLGSRPRQAQFTVWDVGGQDRARPLWRSYTRHTDAIVFVVDASDADRFDECKLELVNVLRSPSMPGTTPVLVLANKQDLPTAVNEQQVEQALGLNDLAASQRPRKTMPCCAVTGEGLSATFDVLAQLISHSRKLQKQNASKNKPPAR